MTSQRKRQMQRATEREMDCELASERQQLFGNAAPPTHTIVTPPRLFPFSIPDAQHPRFPRMCVYTKFSCWAFWRSDILSRRLSPAFHKAQSPTNLPYLSSRELSRKNSRSRRTCVVNSGSTWQAAKSAKNQRKTDRERESKSFAGFWPLKTALIFNNTRREKQFFFSFLLAWKSFSGLSCCSVSPSAACCVPQDENSGPAIKS